MTECNIIYQTSSSISDKYYFKHREKKQAKIENYNIFSNYTTEKYERES